MSRWRPWIPVPAQPLRRTCPACATEPDRGSSLLAQLPITLSCPTHSCRLEPATDVTLAILKGESLPARPVHEPVAELDHRTHEGVTTGMVTLPRRSVHVGVWFRLLRTLLDEVSTALSQVHAPSKTALRRIWQTTGRPLRAGLTVWKPYERLDWPRQEAMLEAAATAMTLIDNGTITARGAAGPLLTPELHRPVYDGDAGDGGDRPTGTPNADPWKQALAAVEEGIDAVRTDPDTARQMLTMFTFPCRTLASFNRTRQTFIDAGIPERFLPTHLQLGRTDLEE